MFEDKVAVITGGGSGIGAATAWHLARNGAKVAILGHIPDLVNQTVSEIRTAGFDAMPVIADISDYPTMTAAADTVMQQWGKIDLLFANAGINGIWSPIDDMGIDEWQRTIDINLTGTFYTVKSMYPHMKANGGAIVVTSSVNGTRIFSNTGGTAYACTKAAQVAFVKMTAIEFAPHNVRINVICPGATETDIAASTITRNLDKIRIPVEFPQGKIPLTGTKRAAPEQVAQLVAFLLSDAASHITGTEMWIDGGQSLLQG